MADDAKPMSQEDIDALLNSLGGGEGSAASRPAEPASSAPLASVDQGELDRLLAALDEVPVTPGAPAPAPSGPLGQDDIDAMFAGLSGGAPAPAAPAPAGPLGQDDIDAMIAGLSGGAPVTPAPAPAMPDGPLGQDDIDAMIAGLSGGAPAAPAPAPAAPDGPLGQDDIDAMIAGLSGGAPATPAPAPAAPDGPLGQDDIDAMIAGLSGGAPAAPPPAPAAPEGPLGQDDIDAMLAGLASGAPAPTPAAPAPAAAAPAGGQLDQSSIDALVASLDAPAAPVAGFGEQPTLLNVPSPEPEAREPAGLSTDIVDALVAKHAATPDEGGEGMIAQSDIDALVKSLGGTAPPPPAGGPGLTQDSMTEQLARHDDAIDQLLAGVPGNGGAMATMDAIDVRAELGRSPAGTPASGPVAYRPTSIPALPVDLRGARWMLLAAVLLLSVCCGTLVVVAGAVKTLAAELKAERTANLAPTDNYSDDFKAALLRLRSPQGEEVAKGVLFLQRLKKRYPSHETEISLELARHFRANGSWREARREYAGIVEETSALQDDPRVHLEYAETLARVKERTAAVRQVNLLLANEAAYIGETNASHLPRPGAEIVANQVTLQAAQLLLGRLLAEDDGRRTVAAADHGSSHHAPAPAAHGEAAHAPAAHGGAH